MKKVFFLVGTSGSFGNWKKGEEAELEESLADGFIAHGNAVLKETAIKKPNTPETATKK